MRKTLKRTALALLALLVVAGIVYTATPRPVLVDATAVYVSPMRVSVAEEGKTRIKERYIVSAPLMGRLRRITLNPGDPVKTNDTVLAVIEPTSPDLLDARALAESEARVRAAQAAVRQAQAAQEQARATYDFSEDELTRISAAHQQNAANIHELEKARAASREASERHKAAQFGLEIARYELQVAQSALLYAQGAPDSAGSQSRMPLLSPIDGAVLRVFRESVSVVSPGVELIEVGDPRDLELVVDVLSTDAVNIAPGQRVIIDQWGGPNTLEGIVRLVEPSAFTEVSALGIEEQRVNVIIDFVSPTIDRPTLGDGFRVEASIITWAQDETLQIPLSAAFRHGSGWAVYTIQDQRARITPFTAGKQNSHAIEVLSGLAEGQPVVLHPSDRLSHGSRVTLTAQPQSAE